MDTYLVAYDICDSNRLRKVARVCEDFGKRRQYSVFFCRLAAVDLVRLSLAYTM
jgi:CRISPR-associated protein Cas2